MSNEINTGLIKWSLGRETPLYLLYVCIYYELIIQLIQSFYSHLYKTSLVLKSEKWINV